MPQLHLAFEQYPSYIYFIERVPQESFLLQILSLFSTIIPAQMHEINIFQ